MQKESLDIYFVEPIINEFINELAKANKGIEYVVGLYAYLCSDPDYAEHNVINTLKPAFGKRKANEVYYAIKGKLSNISKDKLYGAVKYILKEEYSKSIQDEIEKRIKKIEDEKVISTACAIITSIKGKKYPALEVSYDSQYGFIEVGYLNKNRFSEVVSSVLGKDLKSDVRILFYKHLLGFQSDSKSKSMLKIYPFAEGYIKKLARKVPKKFKAKSAIIKKLEELYSKGDFLTLSAIQCALSTDDKVLNFFSEVFGITSEKLREITVEKIINKGYVNPLVYEDVKKAMNRPKVKALKELKELFKDIFEKEGYTYKKGDRDEECRFIKPQAKSIHIYLSPWPNYISIPISRKEDIKAVVIQGLLEPKSPQYLKAIKGCVWLILDKEKRKITVDPLSYIKSDHEVLLNIFRRNNFSIEFSKGPRIEKSAKSNDILEDIVKYALEALGFKAEINAEFNSIGGKKIRLDVKGEKKIDDTTFLIYASCKNYDKPIERDVIEKEIGIMVQLIPVPHTKILVVSSIDKDAKEEANNIGFLVIEVGEKVDKENASIAFWEIYEKLSKIFTGVEPTRMKLNNFN
jgi:hypothetical protein